jgi:hypothetical protein
MENVFAGRVHEVQVTIVQRIGGVLMQTISESLGHQFEHFVYFLIN